MDTLEAMKADKKEEITIAYSTESQNSVVACIQEKGAAGAPSGWPSGGVTLSRMELDDRVRLFSLHNVFLFDVYPNSASGDVLVKGAIVEEFTHGNLFRFVVKSCTEKQEFSPFHLPKH